MKKSLHFVALIWSLAASALLWLHAQLYRDFLSDDALISMRYSERLLEGKGLTWTEGIPVEGYSNLLWVLLTAGLGALGIDLIDAVRLLGFACNVSVIFALMYLFNHLKHPQVSIVPLAIAQLFWVLSGSTAVWTMGGLEQPLVAAGLVWAIALLIPALQKPEIDFHAIVLAAFGLTVVVLTRPDGPLFTVCACIVWWLARPKNKLNFLAGLMLGAIPFVAFAGQMGFRLAYYGDWVPNTAHVKVVFSNSRFVSGATYVIDALATTRPFLEFLLVGCALAFYHKRHTLALTIILVPAFAWLVYIGSVGGDIFPAFRHGLLIYGLMSLALVIVASQMMPGLGRIAPTGLQWALVALCFVPFWVIQVQHPQNKEAFYEKWEWDGQAVGETLKAAFEEQQPLYAITAAGTLPYFSKLPVLDMLGLNDHHIARNPPDNFGEGELGHDLGDGEYVLSRKPALISFCGPYGSLEPCRLSGQQMVEMQEFKKLYQPLFIDIKPTNGREDFTNIQWIRWQDSPIGLTIENQEIRLPAYLGAVTEKTAAHLNDQKQLVLELAPGESAVFPLPVHLDASEILSEGRHRVVLENSQIEPLLLSGLSVSTHVAGFELTNTSDRSLTLVEIQLLLQQPQEAFALIGLNISLQPTGVTYEH